MIHSQALDSSRKTNQGENNEDSISVKLIDEVETRCDLGEGIVWHPIRESFIWTDILASVIYEYQLEAKSLTKKELDASVCSFGLTRESHLLICALNDGFAVLDLDTGQFIHRQQVFTDPRVRLNDGRVDQNGRFWVGSMVLNFNHCPDEKGQLYCLNEKQSISSHKQGLLISNGICWPTSQNSIYLADSALGLISKIPFDIDSGTIESGEESFVQIESGQAPDGAVVDRDDRLWSAIWGGHKVVCVNAAGERLQEVEVPVPQPSCVAFGGKDYNYLAVTSARQDLTKQQILEYPGSGNVFIYKTNVTGICEPCWQGRCDQLQINKG